MGTKQETLELQKKLDNQIGLNKIIGEPIIGKEYLHLVRDFEGRNRRGKLKATWYRCQVIALGKNQAIVLLGKKGEKLSIRKPVENSSLYTYKAEHEGVTYAI